MDFAPTGFKDGQFYPPHKRRQLYEYLHKRGADIQPIPLDAKGPGFRAYVEKTGKPTLYLPENPTVLEVKHELSHYLDCKRLGKDNYVKLSDYQKEKMVLDRLKANRVWDDLSLSEQQFSIDYVERVKAKSLLKHEGVKLSVD